ncbi:flagellar basal body-associated FliL family protein [Paenibacillus sp. FJAT-26967]|uniref:flagellar basal body-associated FliL family protein n=1 Tax=Paenibacillus sp. FJAT-26967 TaxID=1729690 RepID=UPI000839348E|nr:flagellar basal body-associated FliL family protein [Paenibacillus sp. FJAT-26967]
MLKNRFFLMTVSILVAITLILTAAFVLWTFMDNKAETSGSEDSKPITTLEIKENTVIMKDIITNLAEPGSFIKISLAFELENKKAKVDFENLIDSRIKGTIIRTLSDMKAEQIQGSKGQDNLTNTLISKLNTHLNEGKIRRINITDFALE